MKTKTKIQLISVTILIIIGIFLIVFFANAEKINNYDTEIQINQDSSIDVTEKIEYDFEGIERHGIYRDIIVKYPGARLEGNYNLRILDIEVTDLQGNHYTTKTTSHPFDDYVSIRIGDADTYVTGIKTYLIKYKIKRALNYFENHDELYWNVTGEDWYVPILNASATVYLPQEVNNIQAECFSGYYGYSEQCENINKIQNQNNKIIAAQYQQSDIGNGQGLTIVIGWPKGLVKEPSLWQILFDIILDNWVLGVPVLVFILLIYLWYTQGRDPEGRGTIITQFDSPDKITPAQVGTIFDEKVHHQDMSAEIINLAIKGYLKITRKKEKGFFASAEYIFDKLKDSDNKLTNFQKKLHDSIFDSKNTRKLSELKNVFYKDLEKIEQQIYQSLLDKKYLFKNPKKVKGTYITIGIIVIMSAFFTGHFMGASGVIASVLSGLLIMIFSAFMPKKTKKGVLAKEHILGLKSYLTVAEKDRIKFHNAPEKNPQEFERLLPFAMVLGVEKEWAKQFEDIYKNMKPDWYNDTSAANFNALNLTNALNSFNNTSSSALSSRPSSSGASGGSSGFSSGGGFSGGGFGGGGGGSW